MPTASEGITWGLLGLGIIGIGFCIIWIATNAPNPNANEIRKNLGIVAGVSGAAVLVFAIAAYIYFSTHVNYLTPFLLIMTFINLALSVFSTSAATLQITSA
jgi:hypothetical protein